MSTASFGKPALLVSFLVSVLLVGAPDASVAGTVPDAYSIGLVSAFDGPPPVPDNGYGLPDDRADKGGQAGLTEAEAAITGPGYSLGLMAGYGFELGGRRESAEFAEVMPSLAVPLTGVVGGPSTRGVLEYKAEAVFGYMPDQRNGGVVGLSPLGLRYSFTGLGGRSAPYVGGALGFVYANLPDYVQGTKFNFTESVGVGFRYFMDYRTTLNVEFRYRHLSNAGIEQPNDGLNTGFLLVGMSWY